MRERVKWDSTHNPVGLADMVHAGWLKRLLLAADWRGFPGPEPDLVKNGQTRVGAQVRRIFEKLAELDIAYVLEPPDSVPGAQWIRPVTEVLAFRQATCVDLCVTFCCAALDAGIYPLIVTLTTANGKQRHSIVVVPLGRTWSTGCDAVIESGFSREPLAVDGCALAGVVAECADDPTGTWLAIDVQQAMMPEGDWDTALSRGADYLQEWKWDVCVDVGGQRSHKADDAVPPGGNLERILAPARTPLPQDFTPLQLIKARHAVVSFEERSEYRKLRQWATTPARTSTDTANGAGADIAVAVVTGKGGSGKTRMAVELCGDLSSTGWYTGFLRTTTDVTDQELAALEDLATELMVVVDYAEEAQRGRLAEVFRALLVRRAPTRIVLTARGADAWWDEFREEVEQDGLELSNTLVVSNLGKARQEEDQGLLNRIYIRAVRGFSARLYHSIPRSVGLPEDLGDTALDVVLRAWLAVCDEQADTGEEIPTRSDLYDKVLEIEFSQWKKAPVLTKISTNHMRRAAATLSLLAPNQNEDEVDEVLSRLPEWEHEHLRRSRFAELLVHTLLHGDSGDTVSVRPDPVAEYLVLKVFGKKPDLLDQVLPSDPLEVPGIEDPDSDESVVQRALLLGQQSQTVCVALTRAASLDPTRARRLAGRALKARPHLWSSALDVTLIQGGPFAPALENIIASGADLPLAEIEDAIPQGHGALRGVALAATKRLAESAERSPEQQAHWANSLSVRLSAVGDREGALEVFVENLDRFSPATRAYLLLARATWRNGGQEEDLEAAAQEADAADAPAFLGAVRRMIAHAVADLGLELEGFPPWATVTIDPTMRGRLNAWLNCNDLSERADLVEATWSSPSDSERVALSAIAELYVDVPRLRELAAVVNGIAEDGFETVVTRLRCLHRSQVLAEDWYNAHMNGRGAQYLHEHMMRGSDAPQRDSGSDEGSKEEPKEWEKGLYDPSVRAEVLQVLASGLPEAAADEMRRILALAELSDPGTAYAAHTSDEGAEDALKEFLETRNWRAMVAVLEVRPGMGDSPHGRVAAVLAAAAGDDPGCRMRELMDYASEKLDAVDRRLVEALVDVALHTKDCPPAFADLRDWFK